MTFGDALRQARLDAGLTQKQIAHRLGVSVPYVSMLEHDKCIPLRPARIMELVDLLGVENCAWLLASRLEFDGYAAVGWGMWVSADSIHRMTVSRVDRQA